MKVYFPCGYFPPEKAASIYLTDNIVEDAAKSGVDVVIYTPMPTRGVDDATRNHYKKNKVELRCDGKLRVIRFSLYRESTNIIDRTFRYLVCNFKHLCHGLTHKYDVYFVDSTPPTQGLIAVFLKIVKRVKIVYNLQDIFPDSLVGTDLVKKDGILWKIGRVIENFTYKHADKIIVISEDFKKNIMAKGVPEEKIVVVYNWVDEQVVVDVPREENKLFAKYNINPEKFYIEYSGNIGLTQNMNLLLEVMKELQVGYPRIGLVLVGEGAYKKQVEEIIARDGLKNVTMLPFQDYADISHVFSLGNVGLIISKPGVGANSVPSKTWSIMSASRPVIANFDENEVESILSDNACGIFTKAGDKKAFKQAIIELYENPERCKQYGENGRKFVMANLTREVGTQKYVEVIKEVALR